VLREKSEAADDPQRAFPVTAHEAQAARDRAAEALLAAFRKVEVSLAVPAHRKFPTPIDAHHLDDTGRVEPYEQSPERN
jgi:hypothetical protein